MNILVISHEYPPVGGGGANACMHISREYAKMGHNIDIITVFFDGLMETEVIEDYDGLITIYRVHAKRKKKDSCGFVEMMDYLLKSLPLADKLVKKRRSLKCEYGICQIFFGIPSGPVGYYLKKKYRLPYVIRLGGGDIPGFQERFKLLYKLIGGVVKLIWKNADGIIANSQGLKELAMKFCSKYPIDVIYNGVDTDMYYPRVSFGDENKTDSDVINLLFISRLIERKGLQYLIPRINDIEQISGKNIRLLIVGDGPYRSALEKIMMDYNLEEKIVFYGEKNKKELLCYYQMGDIFVFPSKKEGMPNAVLEAMSCGLPIVMSPCQGSDELVENEWNGLIASEELDKFYEAVIELLNKGSFQIRTIGTRSRQKACSDFSWKKTANQYVNVFSQIIKNKK